MSELTSKQPTSTILDAITANLPNEIILTSSSISNEGIKLIGVSLSEQSIAQFIINLENNSLFPDVELTSVNSGTSGEEFTQFTLTLYTDEFQKEKEQT